MDVVFKQFFFVIPFLFAICISTFNKCCIGMRKRKENIKKLVNYRIKTCGRMLISTALYQLGTGTFVT
jgi:hypothetical protein